MEQYNYTDLQQKSNLDQIHRDIEASNMVDKSLIDCTWHQGKLLLNFQNSLDTGDKAILDSIVAAAIGSASDYYFKINNSDKSPVNFNINHFGLYKEEVIDDLGLLIENNYYKNYDGTTYSDLVVTDVYSYYINANDLVETRTETITWYLNNGEVGVSKTIQKYYKTQDAIKEGMRRRTNLIDKAKTYGLINISGEYSPGIPNSHHFFTTILTEVNKYINGVVKDDLITAIQNSAETYLTQQIKDDLVGILQYWA